MHEGLGNLEKSEIFFKNPYHGFRPSVFMHFDLTASKKMKIY